MKSTIKRVPTTQLVIGKVQRLEGIEQRRVDEFVADFKPHLLGLFVVSEHSDGTMVVLDGMHRLKTCQTVGYSGLVDCKVFTGLTIAEEAELFIGYNSGKMPSAISKFNARFLMDEKVAVEITEILERHRWTVGITQLHGCVMAVAALEKVYRNAAGTLPEGTHPDVLDRVIEILTIAWEWDVDSVQGQMLQGMAQIIGRFGAQVDTKKLIGEMQATRPDVLIGRAKTLQDLQGGTVPAALAKILAGMHNKKRRTNLLPEWVWIR